MGVAKGAARPSRDQGSAARRRRTRRVPARLLSDPPPLGEGTARLPPAGGEGLALGVWGNPVSPYPHPVGGFGRA